MGGIGMIMALLTVVLPWALAIVAIAMAVKANSRVKELEAVVFDMKKSGSSDA